MSRTRALNRLMALHPKARLWGDGDVPVSEGAAPSSDGASGFDGFINVHFYEHRITNTFRALLGYNVLISNGFLGSHAYNAALIWLREADRDRRAQQYRHNFKKFFAECILWKKNVLLGRALLVETLVYEQALMTGLFAGVRADPARHVQAGDVATLMSSLLNSHELGHFLLKRDAEATLADFAACFDGQAAVRAESLRDSLTPDQFEEVICDTLALFAALDLPQAPASGPQGVDRARSIAFGFCALFRLIDLEASAHQTADAQAPDEETCTLGSHIRPKDQPTIVAGRHPMSQLREKHVLQVLGDWCGRQGSPLFGGEGPFALRSDDITALDQAFESFTDLAPAPDIHGGTDAQGRAMARLIAEALCGHEVGAEHLLWRSKQFERGGTPVDP